MITFREIIESDAELLLSWRTDPRIASVMLTDIEDNVDNQRQWIASSRLRKDYYHWIVCVDREDVGWISITSMEIIGSKKIATMGFYIGDENYNHITYALLQIFYNYIFSLGFDEIIIWIMDGNSIEKIQKLIGFNNFQDYDKKILKNGIYTYFKAYKLSSFKFLNNKNNYNNYDLPVIYRKYGSIFSI